MENEAPRAWLLMASGDNRGHGGNEGYDDQVDAYYSWDSNVPNSKNLAVGDPIALWDKERLLGVSVIEEIETSRGTKQLNRCPKCGTTRISRRTSRLPIYRCTKANCHHEFDDPRVELAEVDLYRARYDAGWTSLGGPIRGGDVQELSLHVGDINAMRPIKWGALQQVLVESQAERALARVASRIPRAGRHDPDGLTVDIPEGFRRTVVRVRRGQGQFRESILAQQGNVCAFTGDAPERALEAGHLYSYAQLGEHHPHGGLMLRRDIHRLFDDGTLAIDPGQLRIDVAPELERYPQYATLHGHRVTAMLKDEHVEWLGKHWDEHRDAPTPETIQT